jgi:4'-phosphopantetheinyl transferase
MVKIFGIKTLEEKTFQLLEHDFMQFIPDDFGRFRKKFRNNTAMQHSLLGELLVKMVLTINFQLSKEELVFAYSDHNKPFLIQRPNLHYNISHSGEWVVAAFSELPVGVDIEKVKKANLTVADRFFSTEEKSFIQNMEAAERDEWFFNFWTVKESYLKAIGTGLTKPLSSFSVYFEDEIIQLNDSGKIVDVNIRQVNLEGGYKLSVCAFEQAIDDNVKIVALENLLGK